MIKRPYVYFGMAAILALLIGERAFAQPLVSTVVVIVVPNTPSDLTAVPQAPTQVELTWTNNGPNADGVSIERKTGVGGSYIEIATTSPNLATYIDNSVSAGITYFYRVRSYIGSTYSDYSNGASVTTPISSGGGPPSGGGGGGGGGYIPPLQTNVILSGYAYPSSRVFILKDGQLALQTIAGPDANFTASLSDLSAGNYTFSVYGEDSSGHRSATFTFSVSITAGATTMISGIFLSPTIDVNKLEVKKGNTITIFGESVPNAKISIEVDSARPLFATANSNPSGAYLYEFDTAPLAFGAHSTKSKAASGTVISNQSIAVDFLVGSQDVATPTIAPCPPNFPKGDFNQDCRVNLIDFSILAYWWERPGAPALYLIDGTSMVDLRDFSIMAYYWTG